MAAKLIFGCGYLGHRVARRWLAEGHTVYAVTRHVDRAAAWRGEGLHAIVADVTRPATLVDLPAVDSLLFAVGHEGERGRGPTNDHVAGLANVLEAISPAVRRLIYISSTGVYGDCQGEWIDEETACEPQRPSGRACLTAEQMLVEHAYSARTVILRLAGIYGPGRIPRKDVLLAGEPIDAPQHGYLNLIHVDDAVRAVLAADRVSAELPRRYLISDGSPVVRGEYYAELARLLGAPPPRFRPPDIETPAHARAAADKRVCNARMAAELKVALRFIDYRAGLRAIVGGTETPYRSSDSSGPGSSAEPR
ncbi:MAG TPA: SDR family oxidoreductase [Pirellulales bacterium]|nr:SDR family oxidoreductase [Pirellulales bacterium]